MEEAGHSDAANQSPHWAWRPGVRAELPHLAEDGPADAGDLYKLKRPELENYARAVGIENPSSFANKEALVKAIQAA